MAAYPSITMTADVEPINAPRVDVSDGGTVRMVSLNESIAYRISLSHPYLTPSDMTTLRQFYDTNKALAVTITIFGVTYSAYFTEAFKFSMETSIYGTGSVSLVGTPQ